jgi:predicted glycosyltransferase
VTIVAREKDCTLALLEEFGLPCTSVGRAGARNRVAQGAELIRRVAALVRIGRQSGADMLLTRNPAGAIAARLLGIPGIFDTDDGTAAGLHYRLAAPFASVITTPESLGESLGAHHQPYPALKQSAYLHPAHFQADPSVFAELGLAPGEPYALVRFVSMTASHDHGESGLPEGFRHEVVERIAARMPVFVSCEGGVPAGLAARAFRVRPGLMHSAIAHASLLFGDSQTMAAEAAVLGVPNIRVSSFAGRLGYLNELEDRFGLTFSFRPPQAHRALALLRQWLEDQGPPLATFRERRTMLNAVHCDLVDWYCERIEGAWRAG